MSYCRDCNETFERGTILCPRCGSKLVEEEQSPNSIDWPVDDEVNSTGDWSGDDGETSDGNWFEDDATDSTGDWSGDDRTGSTGDWSNEGEPKRSGAEGATSGGTTTAAAHHEARQWRDPRPAQSEPAMAAATDPRFHDTTLLSFAIRFPLGRSGKPLLIDSVMWFGWFLIVPMLFAYGYSFRVGRAAARGDPEPPAFDDVGGLAKDGVVLFGIGLALAVVVVVALGVIGVVETAIAGSPLSPAFDAIVFLGVLAGMYFAGAIVPVLIGTGSLRETFGEFRFAKFALTGYYLLGIVTTIALTVVSYVAFLLATIALAITLVGILLVIPLAIVYPVYLVNVLFATWGYLYNRAVESGDVDPVRPDASLGVA